MCLPQPGQVDSGGGEPGCARLELAAVDWDDVATAGYFGNPAWSWER